MSTDGKTLGHSVALGLWTRHPVVMDELYDLVDEDTPDPGTSAHLIKFARGSQQAQLRAVFAAALADTSLLLDRLRDSVLARFGRAPFIAEPRRIQDPWARRLRLDTGDKVPHGPLSLEIHLASLQSSPEQALYLVIYASSGGIRTRNLIGAWVQSERHALKAPHNVARQPAPDEHAHFGTNAVILHRLMLRDYLAGDDVDLDRLSNTFLADLQWLEPPQWRRLIKAMRSNAVAPA